MSVELPKDAEGREIPLDTVVLFNVHGDAYNITGWTFCTDFLTYSEWANSWRAFTEHGITLEPEKMYLTPPDSWEKLLNDLDRATDKGYSLYCTYFGKKGADCASCRAQAHKEQVSRCSTAALCDISSRIRKLRGED